MSRTAMAIALTVASMLAACSGDDGDEVAEPNDFSVALAENIVTDAGVPYETEEVDCLSAEVVAAIGGADRLTDAGLEPSDLVGAENLLSLGLDVAPDEIDGVAAAFLRCDLDLSDLVVEAVDEEIPDVVRACVRDQLDDEVLSGYFARVLVYGSASESAQLPDDVMTALLACF